MEIRMGNRKGEKEMGMGNRDYSWNREQER